MIYLERLRKTTKKKNPFRPVIKSGHAAFEGISTVQSALRHLVEDTNQTKMSYK